MTTTESEFVFNVVWTGSVFPYLRHFVASQLRHSGARFRFVANGCPPDQVRLMERVRGVRRAAGCIEVFVSSTTIERHGAALEPCSRPATTASSSASWTRTSWPNGPTSPSSPTARRQDAPRVTSGKAVWTDDVRRPPGHPGVPGECFYSQDGYLFGSPHFAMYRRAPLQATSPAGESGIARPAAT